MATYSSVPAVSGQVYSINRQNVSSGPWALIGANGVRYIVLYTCPANSYAVIKCGARSMGGGTSNCRAGLTVLDPNSFDNDGSINSRNKINDATTFCWASDSGGEQTQDMAESIYVGPGQTVYGIAGGNGLNPTGIFELHFSGVQFTNGL